jgi:OmpA-OmpF porin, OOP family
MRTRIASALAILATALLGASPARAEVPAGGIALDQLDPAPAGDAFFSLPSPGAPGHLVARGLLMFDYGSRPLVASSGDTSGAVVGHQAFGHANLSFALFDRVLVTALLPVAVIQGGENPTVGGVTFSSPSARAIEVGDLRLGARVHIFGDEGAKLQLGAGAAVYVPTGPAGSFVGDGYARVAPQVALGGRYGIFTYGGALGVMVRASSNPSALTYGAGAAISLFGDRLQIGPEAFFATPIQEGFVKLSSSRSIKRGGATNAEVLLGAHGRIVGGLVVGAGIGAGLSSAIGTPNYRLVFSVGWSPMASSKAATQDRALDTDEDGVLDADDACPYAFGGKSADPKRNGCPVADRDEDTVPDADDACPDERGEAALTAKRRGCPADRDEDSVPDLLDACPDEKGSAENNGCAAK